MYGSLQQMPSTDKPFECFSLNTVCGFNYNNSTKKKFAFGRWPCNLI